MNLSLILFQQIIVMAILILFGYVAGKFRVLTLEHSAYISKMVLYIIAPCLMIDGLQLEYSRDKLLGFGVAILAAVIFHAVIILLLKVLAPIMKLNNVQQVSMVYTNCGNLLIPIVNFVLGKEYVFYCCAFMVVQNVLIWTHGVSLLRNKRSFDIKKIILNPNILAIILGMILFLARITLPEILGSAVSRTADCVGPVSMFVIGIMIASADLKQIFTQKEIWITTVMRLFFCPLVAIAILFLCKSFIPAAMINILFVFFLATAAPSASTVSQLANIEHQHEGLAGSINVMTVILCIVTMPLMTMLFQALLM